MEDLRNETEACKRQLKDANVQAVRYVTPQETELPQSVAANISVAIARVCLAASIRCKVRPEISANAFEHWSCLQSRLSVEATSVVCVSVEATVLSVSSNLVWFDVVGILQEAGFAKQEQSFQRRLAEAKEQSDRR